MIQFILSFLIHSCRPTLPFLTIIVVAVNIHCSNIERKKPRGLGAVTDISVVVPPGDDASTGPGDGSSADAAGRDQPKPKENSGPSANEKEASLAAYTEHVLPLVTEHCGSCHSTETEPNFATQDAQVGHDLLIQAQKVNFTDVRSSRIVQRLASDNHNCWGICADDARVMETAVAEWAKAVLEARAADKAAVDPNGPVERESAALRLSNTTPRGDTSVRQTSIILEAEAGTLTGVMAANDDNTASGGKYIVVPNGTNPANTGATANINAASFTFEVITPGTYRLWGLIKATADGSNSVQAIMDNGPINQWAMPFDNPTNFVWDVANNGAGNVNAASVLFELSAGRHTLRIAQREAGTMVDKIVLTTDTIDDPAMFDPDKFANVMVNVLVFDLSQLLGGTAATLEIEVAKLDDFSIKARNPTLILGSATAKVKVKNLHILINRKYDARNATFSLIDQIVTGVAPVRLSEAAAILLIDADVAMDVTDISVGFDEIAVVP